MPKTKKPSQDNWIDDNIKIIEFCGHPWLIFKAKSEVVGYETNIDYVATVNNKHGCEPKEIKNAEFSVIVSGWNTTVVIDCSGIIFGPHGHGPEATVFLKNTKKLNSTEIMDQDEIEELLHESGMLTAEMLLEC